MPAVLAENSAPLVKINRLDNIHLKRSGTCCNLSAVILLL